MKIRTIFLLVGSVLFGSGMVWAGLLKIWNNQFKSGMAIIAGSLIVIALCVISMIYNDKTSKS